MEALPEELDFSHESMENPIDDILSDIADNQIDIQD